MDPDRTLFDMSPVPLWEEDLSGVKVIVDGIRARSVEDLRGYLLDHPDLLRKCVEQVRVLGVNRAAIELGQIPNRETAMKGLDGFLHEADYPMFAEGLAQLAAGTSRATIEGQVRNTDGSPVDVIFSTILLPQAKEDWSRVLIAMTDVSELKRLQRHMQDAQRLAKVGSWELDLPANRLWWSDEVYRIFNIDPSGFGASYDAFLAAIHPEDRERVDGAYRAHLEQGVPYDIRHRLLLRDADGGERIRYVQERCRTQRDEDGRPLRSLGTVLDVTDQVLQDQEKLQQARKMEHGQRLESLGVLSGGIAHRFNNLLTAILGHASLAHEDISRPADIRKHLEVIEEAGSRAAAICRQMLAYSGSSKMEPRATDLSALIRDMQDLIEISAGKRAIPEFDLADDLPSLQVDPPQLQQLILNLVTNAREAHGEKPGRISIATRRLGPDHSLAPERDETGAQPHPTAFVCLEIADDGCGMDEHKVQRVFEPFFSTKFTGRGMGMSSVQGIVRSHKGTVTVDSAPGEGTTVRVVLPANDQLPPDV